MNELLDHFPEKKSQLSGPISMKTAFKYGAWVCGAAALIGPQIILLSILFLSFNEKLGMVYSFLVVGTAIAIPSWVVFSLLVFLVSRRPLSSFRRKLFILLIGLGMLLLIFSALVNGDVFIFSNPLNTIIVFTYTLMVSIGIWIFPLNESKIQLKMS